MKLARIAIFIAGMVAGTCVTTAIAVWLGGVNERNAHDAHVIAGTAAAQSGDVLLAEAHFMAASLILDDEYGSWLALARLFEASNRRQDAIRAYELALERIEARRMRASEIELRRIDQDKDIATRRLGSLRAN